MDVSMGTLGNRCTERYNSDTSQLSMYVAPLRNPLHPSDLQKLTTLCRSTEKKLRNLELGNRWSKLGAET